MTPGKMALGGILFIAAALSGCVSDQPNNPASKVDMHEAARLNTQLVLQNMQQGDMAIAQDKLSRAVDQDAGYAQAHAALGMFYARRGNFDEAEKSYRQALVLDDHDPNIRNAVGAYLCDRGKTEEGLRNLIAAAQTLQYGTPEVAWTNAGICARGAQRAADAEQYFRSALQANPAYAGALLQLADLNYAKKDYRAALGFLQRYERVGTVSPDALWLGSRIQRQLGDPQDAHDYEIKLLQKFPNSDQARELRKRTTP